MLSKSLIQFPIEGWGCVPSLLFDLMWNYGGGNENNFDFLQKVPCTHCYTQCFQPCSRLPLTHASTRDSSTLTGKSGSVSCGVTAPFSWVLVHRRFCLCPPKVHFPVLCKFWWLSGGLMATSSKRAYPVPRSTAPRAAGPAQFTAVPYLLRRHSNTVLSQSLWGLWVLVCTRYVWALWVSLVGIGFYSKCDFAPSGYLLKVAPVPRSHHSRAYHLAVASLPLDMWYLLTVTLVVAIPVPWFLNTDGN